MHSGRRLAAVVDGVSLAFRGLRFFLSRPIAFRFSSARSKEEASSLAMTREESSRRLPGPARGSDG